VIYARFVQRDVSLINCTKIGGVPAVDALVFDCSKGDFLDPDAYINAVQADDIQEDAS
jgi:hypothetical protein